MCTTIFSVQSIMMTLFFSASPHSCLPSCLTQITAIISACHSSQIALYPLLHPANLFLLFIHTAAVRIVLCVYLWPWLYILTLKTKLVLSGRDLDTSLSALVQLSNYLSLSLQWPCSLLPFLWWNDFPTVVGWGWVITSPPLRLKKTCIWVTSLYLRNGPVFIKPPKLRCFTADYVLQHKKKKVCSVSKKVQMWWLGSLFFHRETFSWFFHSPGTNT